MRWKMDKIQLNYTVTLTHAVSIIHKREMLQFCQI